LINLHFFREDLLALGCCITNQKKKKTKPVRLSASIENVNPFVIARLICITGFGDMISRFSAFRRTQARPAGS
jgi:hypothetical protein